LGIFLGLPQRSAKRISLYAKGLTTGDIQAHLLELYGTEISRETISKITDAVVEDMLAWQNRPLDRLYPVLLIDAIVIKVGDAQIANRPVYVAIGVNLDGEFPDPRAPCERFIQQGGRHGSAS